MSSSTAGWTSPLQRRLPKADGWLLVSAALLLILGLAMIHSIDVAKPNANFLGQQLRSFVLGLGVISVFIWTPPDFWQRNAKWLYAANIAMLIMVLLFGDSRGGATRWIDIGPIQFQPSELTKLIVTITLATHLAAVREKIRSFGVFLSTGLHILPILVLLILQPHLGSTICVIAIWLATCMVAGVPWRFLGGTVLAVVAVMTFVFFTPQIKAFDYARERIISQFNPDKQENGYQQHQAEIAIGVGGLIGTGYAKGQQKEAGFIPEQQNDFIVTVMGEEGGLFGMSLLLGAFLFFFYRVWLVGFQASQLYHRLIATGILAVLGFHTLVNLGMNLSMTPVVGLWLPFISHGGTALWLCMACVGILTAIRRTG